MCEHHDLHDEPSQEPAPSELPEPPPAGIDRRTFVVASASALGLAALAPALPAEARAALSRRRRLQPVTVVVFQRGGADALQLFAPTGDPAYAQARPTVGIGAPGSGSSVEGLPMDATFSMHPALPGLHALYTAAGSQLAVVHAVGHLPFHRSHFESQDLYETGSFAGLYPDGWINRHLQATAAGSSSPVRALAIRKSLPRSMDGPFPCFAVRTVADLRFEASQRDVRTTLELITDTTPTIAMSATRQGLYQGMVSSFDLIDYFAGIDPAAYQPQHGASYPQSALGQGLKEVAQLVRADLGIEFFQVDQPGWDHHANLPLNIPIYAADLDASLSAFIQDLGSAMTDVVLLVMTEFGREVVENGSNGTDHGAGGAMIVAGGSTQGGQVHGAWPGIAPGALADGRFLQPVNDFRHVIVEVLEDHMGGTDINAVFPNYTYASLGVL